MTQTPLDITATLNIGRRNSPPSCVLTFFQCHEYQKCSCVKCRDWQRGQNCSHKLMLVISIINVRNHMRISGSELFIKHAWWKRWKLCKTCKKMKTMWDLTRWIQHKSCHKTKRTQKRKLDKKNIRSRNRKIIQKMEQD